MFVFIIGPLFGSIKEVVVAASILLTIFEVIIIVRLPGFVRANNAPIARYSDGANR